MIVLTAEIEIKGENTSPFVLRESQLGCSTFGTNIDTTFVVDKRNILSLESEIRDRADVDKPSFGVISSGGSLSMKDNNKILLNYANLGLLTEGLAIRIFLNNTITKHSKPIGIYYICDLHYDNDNRSLTISFNDRLEDLQNITVLPNPIVKTQSMRKILVPVLYNNLPAGYTFEITDMADERLSNTVCKYPYFDSERSLWFYISQVCKICGLFVYKNEQGVLVFSA
jgi:hypothetical protein